MKINLTNLNFYNGIDMRIISSYIPEARNFDDIVKALAIAFCPNTNAVITKKSKNIVEVKFEKGLAVHGIFQFNVRKKEIKRII